LTLIRWDVPTTYSGRFGTSWNFSENVPNVPPGSRAPTTSALVGPVATLRVALQGTERANRYASLRVIGRAACLEPAPGWRPVGNVNWSAGPALTYLDTIPAARLRPVDDENADSSGRGRSQRPHVANV